MRAICRRRRAPEVHKVLIENSILASNRDGRKAIALGIKSPATEVVEMAAHVGFDAVALDGEHGLFSPESVELMCRVANGYGLSVTARVPNIHPSMINRYLDRGVQGVMGPHIESGEEAQTLADACLYPPDGRRSWGGGRGSELGDQRVLDEKYGGKLAFARWANANMMVSAQIESRKGIDNLDEILRVDGVRSYAYGPNDMAASLGHPGEPGHPEVLEAHREIELKVREAGRRMASDFAVGMRFEDDLLELLRRFVESHRDAGVTG